MLPFHLNGAYCANEGKKMNRDKLKMDLDYPVSLLLLNITIIKAMQLGCGTEE